MNRHQLEKKTYESIEKLHYAKGYIAPVDLLSALGVLNSADYLQWKNGKVFYLEKVIHLNLSQISFVMKTLRSYAVNRKLKPSTTIYVRNQTRAPLRFSKSGQTMIEQRYSTHYVDEQRITELKESRKQNDKGTS